MRKRFGRAIADAIKTYVNSPAIAFAYDSHYEDTPLLDFDTRFLKEVLPGEGRLLDIGCGTARHMVKLASHGLDCVGLDLPSHMISLAQAKLEREGLASPLVQANMTAPLPFRSGVFDHVICMFSTIGLIPGAAGRRAFVAEVNRVLKPGGTFVLHVHNRFHNLLSPWGRRWLLQTYLWDRFFTDLETGDRVMNLYRGIEDMYLHIFSLRELRRLLRSAGFEIRRVAYLNARRNGEIPPRSFPTIRANGFLVAAQRRAHRIESKGSRLC